MLVVTAAKRLHDPSTISSLMIRNPRAARTRLPSRITRFYVIVDTPTTAGVPS
jgi:hypothetical protein